MAELDAAGHAGPRPARRPHRRRTRRRTPGRADPADPPRAAAPAPPPGSRPGPPTRRSAGLVLLAATTPTPRPRQPLPTPSSRPFMIKESTAGVLGWERYWNVARNDLRMGGLATCCAFGKSLASGYRR